MEEKKSCIIWTRPLDSLCMKVIKHLQSAGVEIEERPVDNALWSWAQFKAASPDWSNLPLIQKPDGTQIKNIKELEAWIGKDESVYNPPVRAWNPR
jgi:hypothetical protein